MALFRPAQLEELRQLSNGMLGHVRKVLRGQDEPAARFGTMMQRLKVGYGMPGAAFAVRAWLDTVIETAPTFNRGEIQALVFANETGTGYQDTRAMTPDYRWAAQALLARISDDQVKLYQLIEKIPPEVAGIYLLRVLQVCAGLLNAYERPDPPDLPVRVGEVVTVRVACVGQH